MAAIAGAVWTKAGHDGISKSRVGERTFGGTTRAIGCSSASRGTGTGC
ncbi:MAG TPA: hypothetical protein VG938_16815 [Verrucomicrobiae bacterium]|nr:hypothetical protein [Verrucomicrobiae bacterium]